MIRILKWDIGLQWGGVGGDFDILKMSGAALVRQTGLIDILKKHNHWTYHKLLSLFCRKPFALRPFQTTKHLDISAAQLPKFQNFHDLFPPLFFSVAPSYWSGDPVPLPAGQSQLAILLTTICTVPLANSIKAIYWLLSPEPCPCFTVLRTMIIVRVT